MSKNVVFKTREPIGSSTFPMPNEDVNFEKTMAILSQRCPEKKRVSTLYIHIPFCDQICSFCGFNKYLSPEAKKDRYVTAFLEEIKAYGRLAYIQSLKIEAVYLGGGTPNSLSVEQLDQVLGTMHDHLPLVAGVEITCEGTPQNFDQARIDILKKHGVNRVSAGVQTFDTDIRREHLNMRDGRDALLGMIKRIEDNFENFNLDMIYNLPKQTFEQWQIDIETVLNTRVSHLTLYPLVLLENTSFYMDYVKRDKYAAPEQNKEIQMFNWALERLNQTEFVHRYTVRDWSKKGKDCKYIRLNAEANQVLALGAGAHGYVGDMTYRTIKSPDAYSKAIIEDKLLPLSGQKFCDSHEEMQRYMVMGLRLLNRDMLPFEHRFGKKWTDVFGDKVQDMVHSGYLKVKDDTITFTNSGYVWANNVRTYFETQRGKSVGYTDTVGIDESGKGHYQSISRIKASADVEAHQ